MPFLVNILAERLKHFGELTLFDPLTQSAGFTNIKVAVMDIQILRDLARFITLIFEVPVFVAGFH